MPIFEVVCSYPPVRVVVVTVYPKVGCASNDCVVVRLLDLLPVGFAVSRVILYPAPELFCTMSRFDSNFIILLEFAQSVNIPSGSTCSVHEPIGCGQTLCFWIAGHSTKSQPQPRMFCSRHRNVNLFGNELRTSWSGDSR